jgi:hypothetical protein
MFYTQFITLEKGNKVFYKTDSGFWALSFVKSNKIINRKHIITVKNLDGEEIKINNFNDLRFNLL